MNQKYKEKFYLIPEIPTLEEEIDLIQEMDVIEEVDEIEEELIVILQNKFKNQPSDVNFVKQVVKESNI